MGKKFREVNEMVEKILSEVTKNIDFYKSYLSYFNIERISSDYFTIRNQFKGKNYNILDVGALPPLMVALLEKDKVFANYTIADPNAEDFKIFFQKRQINYYNIDIIQNVDAILKESFDVVCANEVLEHLPNNILNAMRNISSCLKRGGYLYVTTPVLNSLTGFFSIFLFKSGMASKPTSTVREQYEKFESYGYYGHLREFTNREVILLIESLGYRLVRFESRSFNLSNKLSFQIVKFLENFTPKNRLFGKYIFQKL